ncbi:MAG TPA: pilus assembly protein PilM, partial [Gemmataceae bacterium]|nr:pilus assembly protein PilM [Gemmataceae bacterium]
MSRYLAIDLDPEGLFVVAGTARGGVRVEQALSWLPSLDEGGPPPLSAETARAVGEQLRERLRAAGIAAGPTVVAVGRDKVILKELRYPAVAPTEEPALVRFQALKEITEAPEEVVLDYAPLANGAADGERRSLAVILRKEVFAAIQTACAAAGLKLAGVTPRPFAVAAGLARAFAARSVMPPDTPDEAVAVVTLGPAGGEFTVIRHGEVAFTRAIPAPVVASEPLLIGQVRRDLAVYAGQAPAHPVQSVYVAEAGPVGWTARLRTAIGMPVHHYDPIEGAAPEIAGPARGRFAGAAGLLAGRAADALPINFAAPRQPKAEANPHKQKILLAALVALLLIAAGGALGYMELSAAERRVATLQSRKTQLQEKITALEPAAKQLEAVE